jgi:4-hydroxy-tetrahydrodipicolinate reductase
MKLAIAGASGRMGRMILGCALSAPDITIACALDRADSPELGRDCGEALGQRTGVLISSSLDTLAGCDVLIDFTRPEATLAHADACLRHGVGLVVGTTGFDAAGKATLQRASHTIGVVFAPNMSVGVQALLRLVELGARLLNEGYDLEILEMHHRDKVDAPSGTALQLGEVAARARGVNFDSNAVLSREGHTGPRRAGTIGFATLRGGDVVGDHSVILAGNGERLEITHRSTSRLSYAQGSLRAARFLRQRPPGLYSMSDVLA